MSKPVVVKGTDLASAIKEHIQEQEEIARKVAAMTPEERAAWEEEEKKHREEVEEILKELRGPGFVELEL